MSQPRRGLIFWAFRLRSFRCERCSMDLVYREKSGPPIICRWCGRCPVNIPPLFVRFMAVTQAFTDAMASLQVAVSKAADDLAEMFAAYDARPEPVDDMLDAAHYAVDHLYQTRVDTDPNAC